MKIPFLSRCSAVSKIILPAFSVISAIMVESIKQVCYLGITLAYNPCNHHIKCGGSKWSACIISLQKEVLKKINFPGARSSTGLRLVEIEHQPFKHMASCV